MESQLYYITSRRQCWLFVLLLVFILSSCVPAQLAVSDIQSIQPELDQLLDETVRDEEGQFNRNAFLYVDIPSVGLQYAGSAGLGRVDTQEPADVQQQFIVASVAKNMTAVIIHQMAEEDYFGAAGIDVTLADLGVLPPDVMAKLHLIDGVSYVDHITLRHLLNHTSGLRDLYFDGQENPVTLMPGTAEGAEPDSLLGMAVNDEQYGLAAQVKCALQGVPTDCNLKDYRLEQHWVAWDEVAWRADPQDGQAGLLNFYLSGMNEHALWLPGEGFHYSDTNYVLLGLVIEKLSGNSLHTELRTRIFDPLGMDDTYLVGASSPAAGDYERNLAESWAWNEPAVSAGVDFSFDWGGGGVVSTLADMAVYMRALVGGGLFRNEETLLEMFTVPRDVRGIYYGSGLIVFPTDDGPVMYLMGSNGTWVEYYPPLDMIMVGTTNDFSNMPAQFQLHGRIFSILANHGLKTPMADFFALPLVLVIINLLILFLLYLVWFAGIIFLRQKSIPGQPSLQRVRWLMALSVLFNLLMLFLAGVELGSDMFQMLFGLSPVLKHILKGTALGVGVFGLLMAGFNVNVQRHSEGSSFERILLWLVNLATLFYVVFVFWLA